MTNAQLDNTTARRSKRDRKRIIIAGGSVLLVAALMTAAAFTDIANINLGASANGEAGGGIGGSDSPALHVARTDADGIPVTPVAESDWVSANTAEGINYVIPGADSMAPGDAPSVTIPIRNAGYTTPAETLLTIEQIDGMEQTLSDSLLFSVSYTSSDGETVSLVTDRQFQGSSTTIPMPDAIGLDSREEGAYTVSLKLQDGADFDGLTAHIRASIVATGTAS
jgi:hypothetical protein